MKKQILIILILVLLVPLVQAKTGHITLLTVSEISENETVGGTADLFLEIKPGTGRVFIDSFPLTKVDTQISTRFAKEVACSFLEKDCSTMDFFYTIRAKSNIVGGPSAGGAITLLTVSMLDNTPIDNKVVMTGTINAGGLIGPVSGVKEKTEAAKRAGFTKVIVPKWSIISEFPKNLTNETNFTITYADELEVDGIQIIPVTTLEEALEEFTGKKYSEKNGELVIPELYQEIMKDVAQQLCDRYEEIKLEIPEEVLKEKNATINITESNVEKALKAFENNDYYSAASFCFTSNTRIRTVQFSNYSNESLRKISDEVKLQSEAMMKNIDSIQLKTLSDLETYIIVKERLYETKILLEGNESEVFSNLGYTYERLYSAAAWSNFFNYESKEVQLDEEHLSNACLSKIAEADERVGYVDLLYNYAEDMKKEIGETRTVYENGDYAFCLFKASKIKADANAILTSAGITLEKVPELVSDQLKIAEDQIIKQGEDFPILGFSYYNYASSLKQDNPSLATLFSSYAVELSNLNMYFPEKKSSFFNFRKLLEPAFLWGLAAGIIVTTLIMMPSKYERKKRKK